MTDLTSIKVRTYKCSSGCIRARVIDNSIKSWNPKGYISSVHPQSSHFYIWTLECILFRKRNVITNPIFLYEPCQQLSHMSDTKLKESHDKYDVHYRDTRVPNFRCYTAVLTEKVFLDKKGYLELLAYSGSEADKKWIFMASATFSYDRIHKCTVRDMRNVPEIYV